MIYFITTQAYIDLVSKKKMVILKGKEGMELRKFLRNLSKKFGKNIILQKGRY